MAGERDAEMHNGTRDVCGKYLHPVRRGAQQEKARLRARGVTVSVYACPAGNDGWHVGHDAQDARNGTATRAEVQHRRDLTRVTAYAQYVGAPLVVTFADPRAAARCCDALEAAADALEQAGMRDKAGVYRRDAGRLADALERAAVPPVNA